PFSPPSAASLQNPANRSPRAARPFTICPLGRLICASSGYWASRRFQSHALSASKCSSKTAWALGCFFRSGSFIWACAPHAPPNRAKVTKSSRMTFMFFLPFSSSDAQWTITLQRFRVLEAFFQLRSAPTLPQRFEPVAERLGPFGEQAVRDARGAVRQFGGVFGAGRRQPRAPMRQRLMRLSEALENLEVLTAPEPVAQPFSFLGPHAAVTRTERLAQLHLIAVIDDALAQMMQVLGARLRPVGRNTTPRGAIAGRQARRDRAEFEWIERPQLDRSCRGIEPGDDRLAQFRRQHLLL